VNLKFAQKRKLGYVLWWTRLRLFSPTRFQPPEVLLHCSAEQRRLSVSQMHITHASPDDARVVAQIHVDSWREAYKAILPAEYLASLSVEKRQAWWEKCIAEGKPELLVAKTNEVVHGWINFSASRDEDATPTDGEIWAIYVSPASWSSGTGRQLWHHASERLRSQGFQTCSLWVFPQNARAIRFYEAAGFALDSVPPKSFQLAGLALQEVRYVCHLNAEALS